MDELLTQQEVMDYLGVSISDARFQRRCTHLINVADRTLRSSIGNDYPKDDPRVKELALAIIEDLYDSHEYTDKVGGNIKRLIQDFTLQLKIELAIKNEESSSANEEV